MMDELRTCARGVYRMGKVVLIFGKSVAVIMAVLTVLVGPLFAALEGDNAHWLWIYLVHFAFFSYHAGKD